MKILQNGKRFPPFDGQSHIDWYIHDMWLNTKLNDIDGIEFEVTLPQLHNGTGTSCNIADTNVEEKENKILRNSFDWKR